MKKYIKTFPSLDQPYTDVSDCLPFKTCRSATILVSCHVNINTEIVTDETHEYHVFIFRYVKHTLSLVHAVRI